MREIRIRKGDKVRVVYAPEPRQARKLRGLLPKLMEAERAAARSAGTEAVAHGFIAGRNPVTCARPHVGCQVTISADLSGWFDSVRPEQIREGLETGGLAIDEAARLAGRVCHLGAPRQGLPTSPAAANLAAVEMDRRILAALAAVPCRTVYTRYADDLSVSLGEDHPGLVAMALAAIQGAAESMGWTLATHKTRVQRATAGRRVIVGVSVGPTDLKPPREMRRKLRAARFNAGGEVREGLRQSARFPGAQAKADGLAEWCAMRLPRACRPARQIVRTSSASAVVPAPASPVTPVEPRKFIRR